MPKCRISSVDSECMPITSIEVGIIQKSFDDIRLTNRYARITDQNPFSYARWEFGNSGKMDWCTKHRGKKGSLDIHITLHSTLRSPYGCGLLRNSINWGWRASLLTHLAHKIIVRHREMKRTHPCFNVSTAHHSSSEIYSLQKDLTLQLAPSTSLLWGQPRIRVQ